MSKHISYEKRSSKKYGCSHLLLADFVFRMADGILSLTQLRKLKFLTIQGLVCNHTMVLKCENRFYSQSQRMNSANSQTLTQEKFIFKGWRYRALSIDSEGGEEPQKAGITAGLCLY